MAKLIGNEPNQVPTNGDLGKLAFQEPEAVNITGGTLDSVTVTNLTTDGASLDGAVVINESGADVDFRIESDTNQYALFVDAGNSAVKINTSATNDDPLTIQANTGADAIRIIGRASGNASRIDFYEDTNTSRQLVLSSESLANYIVSEGTIPFQIYTNAVKRMEIDGSGNIVFNETGADADFRVESDNNTHMLFVDASNQAVAIGSQATYGLPLSVRTRGNSAIPTGALIQSSDNQVIGIWNSDADAQYAGIRLETRITGASGWLIANEWSSFAGSLVFRGRYDGSNSYEALRLNKSNGAVFNEGGLDTDFRVESNNNSNMLTVDAGNDAVGIGMEPTDRGSLAIPNGDILWMGGSYHCSVTGNGGTSNDKKLVVAFDRYSGYIQMGTIEVLFSGSRQTGGTSAAHAKVLVGFKFLNNIITVNTTTELLKYGITTISSSASGNELTITFSGSNVYSCNRLAAHCVVTMTLAEASYNGNPYSFILGNT